MTKQIESYCGVGVLFALVTTLFDTTLGQQSIMFVFGFVYGGFWIRS